MGLSRTSASGTLIGTVVSGTPPDTKFQHHTWNNVIIIIIARGGIRTSKQNKPLFNFLTEKKMDW